MVRERIIREPKAEDRSRLTECHVCGRTEKLEIARGTVDVVICVDPAPCLARFREVDAPVLLL